MILTLNRDPKLNLNRDKKEIFPPNSFNPSIVFGHQQWPVQIFKELMCKKECRWLKYHRLGTAIKVIHRASGEPLVQEQADPTFIRVKSREGREEGEHLLHKPYLPLQWHQNPRSHPEPRLILHFCVDADCCLLDFLNYLIFHVYSPISISSVSILSQALVPFPLNHSKSLCWFTPQFSSIHYKNTGQTC